MEYITAAAESVLQMFGQAVTVGVSTGLLTATIYTLMAILIRGWRVRREKKEARNKKAVEEASQVETLLKLYETLGLPDGRDETAFEHRIPVGIRDLAKTVFLRRAEEIREKANQPEEISAWICEGCRSFLTTAKAGHVRGFGCLCAGCTQQLKSTGRLAPPSSGLLRVQPELLSNWVYATSRGKVVIPRAEPDDNEEGDEPTEDEEESEEQLEDRFYSQVDQIHEAVARKRA